MKEDRRFNRTLERAVTNFWTVMGEYGVGVGEPTQPRGVGGIKVIAGRTLVGTSSSEGDVPIVYDFAQSAVKLRASTAWKCRCFGSSTTGIHKTSLVMWPTLLWLPFGSFKVVLVSWIGLMIV